MTSQSYPIIEIDATFPSTGSVTGEIHMKKAAVNERVEINRLVDDAFDQATGGLASAGEGPARQSVAVDLGGGNHILEIDMTGVSAEDGQWGAESTSNESQVTEASASTGDRIQKQNVWNNYIRHSTPDSRHPARLIYGGWSPGGIMPRNSLPVTFLNAEINVPRDDASTFTGSIVMAEVIDLSGATGTSGARID